MTSSRKEARPKSFTILAKEEDLSNLPLSQPKKPLKTSSYALKLKKSKKRRTLPFRVFRSVRLLITLSPSSYAIVNFLCHR
jgi:hypothetical protein